jgi:hypothetical protein
MIIDDQCCWYRRAGKMKLEVTNKERGLVINLLLTHFHETTKQLLEGPHCRKDGSPYLYRELLIDELNVCEDLIKKLDNK